MPRSRTVLAIERAPYRAVSPALPPMKVTVAKVIRYGADREPQAGDCQFSQPWAVMTDTFPPVTLSTFASLDAAYAWLEARALSM